jgi:hypothetical protein
MGCNSDNDCTPMGELCNLGAGYCAECLRHADCADGAYCSDNLCALNVCRLGQLTCRGKDLLKCNTVGNDFDPLTTCGARQSCVVTGAEAECRDWICTPGQTECYEQEVIVCSEDGFSIIERIDCTLTGQDCVDGECVTP